MKSKLHAIIMCTHLILTDHTLGFRLSNNSSKKESPPVIQITKSIRLTHSKRRDIVFGIRPNRNFSNGEEHGMIDKTTSSTTPLK